MKTLIKAHVVTAVLGWIAIIVMAGYVLPEGSLAAVSALCIVGVATGITLVDLFSVYFAKKGSKPFLPAVSTTFWGVVIAMYGIALFSPDQPWQGRAIFGGLVLIAAFKVWAAVSLYRARKSDPNNP